MRCKCVFAAALIVSASRLLAADPSPADPFLPIKHAGVVSEAQKTWAEIVANDQAIRKAFARFSKAKVIDGKDFGKLYVQFEQFQRHRRELEECGEPSSVDFRMREAQYKKFVLNAATRYWGSPKSTPQRQRVLVGLQRDLAQRVKRIQKIGAMGDPVAAEAALDKYLEDLFSTAGILAPKEKDIAYQGLSPVDSRVRTAASQVRRKKAGSEMAMQMNSLRGDYDKLIADIKQQTSALATGGARWAGQPTDGPGVLEGALAQWKAVHIGFVKLCAIKQMAPRSASDTDYGYSGEGEGDDANSSEQSTDGIAQKLAETTVLAMKDLVAADSQSGTPQEAASKYHRYIRLIADVRGRLDNESLVAHFDAPLDALAARAGLSQVVSAYAAATDEILEWTRRAANSRGESLQKSFPAVESFSRAKLPSTKQQPGMYSLENASVPVLLKPVPQLVGEVDAALKGASVSTDKVVALDGGKIFMGQLREGFYARLPLKPADNTAEAIQALRSDLLLAGGGQPLTVAATAAIQSATVGNYERAGGKITGFAIEAALSRYASLPSIASALVPVGYGLPRPAKGSPLSALALRLDLEPAWLQHRHFVVMLK
ncbi:MAG: hypothetical protein Aurels2KO_17310 [Aureliella sp.]